jgi:hypothetical protein
MIIMIALLYILQIIPTQGLFKADMLACTAQLDHENLEFIPGTIIL